MTTRQIRRWLDDRGDALLGMTFARRWTSFAGTWQWMRVPVVARDGVRVQLGSEWMTLDEMAQQLTDGRLR